ncbi:MAG: hypothetical protein ACRDKT_05090, partial [Actinomycetota bacterium]
MKKLRLPQNAVIALAAVAIVAALLPGAATAARPDDVVNPQCDPLDPAVCLLPFPNDRFTRADE